MVMCRVLITDSRPVAGMCSSLRLLLGLARLRALLGLGRPYVDACALEVFTEPQEDRKRSAMQACCHIQHLANMPCVCKPYGQAAQPFFSIEDIMRCV